MTQIRYFKPAADEASEWHAYREESAQALCGEATLSYNRDSVADVVPTDGILHDGCRQAIDAENPAPYTPHVAEVTSSGADDAATEAGGGEGWFQTGDGSPADAQGAGVDPETSAETTETQEVTSDDVASADSVLGGVAEDGTTGSDPAFEAAVNDPEPPESTPTQPEQPEA